MPQQPTSADELAKLRAQVEALTQQLSEQAEKTTIAEDEVKRLASVQSVAFMQREIHEQPTGKKVKVKRLLEFDTVGYKEDGRPILKPKFHEVELPTYYYKIDLPPSGGVDIKVNGVPRFHGETYELDLDELRSIKDQVARSWQHEASIMGSNENAYRKQTNRVLRGGGKAH